MMPSRVQTTGGWLRIGVADCITVIFKLADKIQVSVASKVIVIIPGPETAGSNIVPDTPVPAQVPAKFASSKAVKSIGTSLVHKLGGMPNNGVCCK
jgi:hypothetical protein